MTTARGLPATLLLACLLAALSVRAGEPEPDGYRGEPYLAPVPETLAGAVVLDDAAAHALWSDGAARFVDVLPRAPKPSGLPEGTLWLDRPHASIPGAIWLPNTGYQAIDATALAYFLDALDTEAGGRSAPVVFFCKRDCWMSWNAAKRALAHGFETVFWYPDGTDGWQAAGHALAPVEPYDVSR